MKPRSSRDDLGGERLGALVVRLTAPPVDGQANAALSRFLGRKLGLPPSAVRLLRGDTGRDKVVEIAGLAAAVVRERLADGGPRR